MLAKIENLYNTKPLVFYAFAIVLVPFALLLIFQSFVSTFMAAKANQSTKDAELKDKALKTAISALSAQANTDQSAANSLGQEAKDVDVSPDWNKK